MFQFHQSLKLFVIILIILLTSDRTDSEHVIFPHPSVQITKGSIGRHHWPACDLFLSIWWCVHCFWAAAFHHCLPAALFTVAAIVLPALYNIFFTPSHWSESSCWCVPGLMQWRVQCIYFKYSCVLLLNIIGLSVLSVVVKWKFEYKHLHARVSWLMSFIMRAGDDDRYLFLLMCPCLCMKSLS